MGNFKRHVIQGCGIGVARSRCYEPEVEIGVDQASPHLRIAGCFCGDVTTVAKSLHPIEAHVNFAEVRYSDRIVMTK